jgi:hypothetical protein
MKVIKPRKMKLVGHVACMKETRNTYKTVEEPEGADRFGNIGIYGRIILK